MPLKAPAKKSIFKDKFTSISRKTGQLLKSRSIEFILVLMIALNLFITARAELIIFIILFFADRWQVFNKLIDKIYDRQKIQDTDLRNDP